MYQVLAQRWFLFYSHILQTTFMLSIGNTIDIRDTKKYICRYKEKEQYTKLMRGFEHEIKNTLILDVHIPDTTGNKKR